MAYLSYITEKFSSQLQQRREHHFFFKMELLCVEASLAANKLVIINAKS